MFLSTIKRVKGLGNRFHVCPAALVLGLMSVTVFVHAQGSSQWSTPSNLGAVLNFSPAVLVPELNTPSDDQRPNVRKDGLEIIFDSSRTGSIDGSSDLWTSSRKDTSTTWSQPVNLGTAVNTPSAEGRPSLSFDGRTLYFMSAMPGGAGGQDLYVTTRIDRVDRPSVTGVAFEPSTIRAGESLTATFSGSNLTFTTYFDIRVRTPGSSTEEVVWNWQSGAAAQHSVSRTTMPGQWVVTGVRAHLDAGDHSGAFVPVALSVIVSP